MSKHVKQHPKFFRSGQTFTWQMTPYHPIILSSFPATDAPGTSMGVVWRCRRNFPLRRCRSLGLIPRIRTSRRRPRSPTRPSRGPLPWASFGDVPWPTKLRTVRSERSWNISGGCRIKNLSGCVRKARSDSSLHGCNLLAKV